MTLQAPTFPVPPTSREYVHAACGGRTAVGGYHLDFACDPFLPEPTGRCGVCGRSEQLRQFAWADTGETLVDYRARLRRLTPPAVARWRGPLKIVLIVGLTMLGLACGVPFVTQRSIAGPVIGTVVGLAASICLLALLNRKNKIDYRLYR